MMSSTLKQMLSHDAVSLPSPDLRSDGPDGATQESNTNGGGVQAPRSLHTATGKVPMTVPKSNYIGTGDDEQAHRKSSVVPEQQSCTTVQPRIQTPADEWSAKWLQKADARTRRLSTVVPFQHPDISSSCQRSIGDAGSTPTPTQLVQEQQIRCDSGHMRPVDYMPAMTQLPNSDPLILAQQNAGTVATPSHINPAIIHRVTADTVTTETSGKPQLTAFGSFNRVVCEAIGIFDDRLLSQSKVLADSVSLMAAENAALKRKIVDLEVMVKRVCMRYEDSLKTTHASAALQVLCTLSGTSSEQERNQEIETHDAIDNMSAAESAANAIHEIGAMGPFSLDNMRKHLTHDSLHNESFATETRKHKKIIIPRRFSICIDRDFFELNFAARNEQKLLINRISTSICCDISIDPPSGRKLVFGEEAKEFYELEATGASGKLDAVVTLLRERVVRNFPKMRDQDFSRAVKTYRY